MISESVLPIRRAMVSLKISLPGGEFQDMSRDSHFDPRKEIRSAENTYVTSARSISPVLPPEFMYVTLRSVETPVAKSPLEATANEPPRSTRTWNGQYRLCDGVARGRYPCSQSYHHGGYRDDS